MSECKYCHGTNCLRSSLVGDSCLIIKENGNVDLLEQPEYDCEPWNIGTFKFRFCPICGRKLSEVQE